MATLYNRADENKKEAVLFILIFLVFLAVVIYIVNLLFLRNYVIVVFLLTVSFIFTAWNFFYSKKFILKQNKALPLEAGTNQEIYNSVENLCITCGLPVPRLYYTPDLAINAFTVGSRSEDAVLVFTKGALSELDRSEIEGVIAHELSHIENRDILLSTILAFLLGFIRSIVNLVKRITSRLLGFFVSGGQDWTVTIFKSLILLIFYSAVIFLAAAVLVLSAIPFVEQLIFYKISRGREFLADAEGVLLTRYPKGLIGALEKIARDDRALETVNAATAHLYIASPFREKWGHFWSGFFHSHPPIEERIEILKKADGYGDNNDSVVNF